MRWIELQVYFNKSGHNLRKTWYSGSIGITLMPGRALRRGQEPPDLVAGLATQAESGRITGDEEGSERQRERVIAKAHRRHESFRLKAWAGRFLVLRMALEREEYPERAAEVEAAPGEARDDDSRWPDRPRLGG